MTVPIPVLLERPSVSGAGREGGVKRAAAAYSVKSKFAQNLAREVKKQNSQEVNEKNKDIQKTSSVESGEQVLPPEKECQTKDTGQADSMPPIPEMPEDIPVNEAELKDTVNQPLIIEPVLNEVVAAQIDAETAHGSKMSQSPVLLPLDQPTEGSEPAAAPLISQVSSGEPDDMAGSSIPVNNGDGKIREQSRSNNDQPLTKPVSVNESGLEFNPKHNVIDSSQKTDKQEFGQALVMKMPHEYAVKKNTMQGRETEADKTSTVSSPVVEKTETNLQTDVKKIMDMENHIRPGKVVMAEADGEKMGQNNSQSDQGQDSPKFNLLPNQTDSLQVRTTSSKMLEFPVKEQVDPKDLIQQIVKKAEIVLKSDISEMKMQLKPEFLGKMLIKVTVEEGTVVTKIITENQHVKQVLEANLNSLRQNLEANGMKVEKTEVSVQLFNDGGGNFSQSDSNRYPFWSEQQGQNRRSYPDNNYGLPEMENLSDLPEETVKYGIGSEGQVNYLI